MSKIEKTGDTTVLITLDEAVPYSVLVTITDAGGLPVSLVGKICKMQARSSPDDATVLLEKTEGSGLTNGGAAGTITIDFTAADSTDKTWQRAVFDIKVTGLMRVLRGAIEIEKGITT